MGNPSKSTLYNIRVQQLAEPVKTAPKIMYSNQWTMKSKVYWLVCFLKKLDLLYLRLYPADNGPSGITQKFNKNPPWLEIHSKAETETIIHIRKLHGSSF